MNGDSFSLKARRTTRIPLRIPIVLVYHDGQKERSLDAWTLIVNVNGARVECKHLFEDGDEVTLRVPHLSKSQKGTIVWRDANANKNGGYECGIKLDKPENLWGVGFPPSDWSMRSAGIDDLLPTKPAAAPPPTAKTTPPLNEPTIEPVISAEPEPRSVKAEQKEPVPVAAPPEFPILAEETTAGVDRSVGQEPLSDSQTLDLTSELKTPVEASSSNPSERLLQKEANEPVTDAACELPGNEPSQEASGAGVIEQESGSVQMEQEPAVQILPPAFPRPEPRDLPSSLAAGMNTASDRLSTIFHELVESALEQRVQGLVEGMAARMEARIAHVEAAAMSQMEQRVTSLVESQSERLQGRVFEITSSRQAALEQSVREYLEAQEQAALHKQQEMIQETSRTAYEEMGQTAAMGTQRMMEQAEEILSAARSNLRQGVQQELPTLEQEVFTRARAKGEEAATACFDEMNRRLPERIEHAGRSINQQIDRVIEERMGQFNAKLTARSEQLQAETKARVEQQIQEVWKQTNQAFLRHIIGELNQKKQAWLDEVQGDLKEASNQNLAWIQQRTTQILKNLGESLVERAGEMGCALEMAAAGGAEAHDDRELLQLVESHSGIENGMSRRSV